MGQHLIDFGKLRQRLNLGYLEIHIEKGTEGKEYQTHTNPKEGRAQGRKVGRTGVFGGKVALHELLIAAPNGHFKNDINYGGREKSPVAMWVPGEVEHFSLTGLGGQFPGFEKPAHTLGAEVDAEQPTPEKNDELNDVRGSNSLDTPKRGIQHGKDRHGHGYSPKRGARNLHEHK